jgi:hypothetical protein
MTRADAATRRTRRATRPGEHHTPGDERRQALGWIAGQLAWESRLDALRDDPVDGAAAEHAAEHEAEPEVDQAPAA